MRTEAKTMRKLTLLLMAMALVVLLAAVPAQAATTFTVNSTTDAQDANPGDGACSTAANECTLRAAIQEANALTGDDVIGFDPSVSGTITLGGSELLINSNLKINGPGADVLSVSANNQSRVFNVQGGTVVIRDLTITGGKPVGESYLDETGGGVHNKGTLTVSDSTITGNTAGADGGGIWNSGSALTVERSTISGNTANSAGGGIYSDVSESDFTKTTTVTNSTISGNTAWNGGGVYNYKSGLMEIEYSTITNNEGRWSTSGVGSYGDDRFARTEVYSSIISGNATTHGTNSDVENVTAGGNSFVSEGYNLIGGGNAKDVFNQTSDRINVTDPGLETLSLSVPGTTKTHALKERSLALNQGPPDSECPAVDQRGVERPQRGKCDIGAFEKTPDTTAPDAPIITGPPDGSYDNDGSFTISGTTEPNTLVKIFEDGNYVNGAFALVDDSGYWSNSDGNFGYVEGGTGYWSIEIGNENHEVSEGAHSYTAKAQDYAGNESVASEAHTVTVDKTAPGAPLITSPAEGARFTVSSLTLSGSVEAGAKVELFDGEVSRGETTAGSDGAWSITLSGVSDGSHSYKAKATDAAGNTSAESGVRTVKVDATAPTVRRVLPVENATGIGSAANVSAAFSETMRATSVNQRTFKLYKKGSTTAIRATVTYDAATKRAVLNPSANLKRGVTYKAVVTSGARDLAKNALDQDPSVVGNQMKVWFFTIKP